jgi:hypothetical protein
MNRRPAKRLRTSDTVLAMPRSHFGAALTVLTAQYAKIQQPPRNARLVMDQDQLRDFADLCSAIEEPIGDPAKALQALVFIHQPAGSEDALRDWATDLLCSLVTEVQAYIYTDEWNIDDAADAIYGLFDREHHIAAISSPICIKFCQFLRNQYQPPQERVASRGTGMNLHQTRNVLRRVVTLPPSCPMLSPGTHMTTEEHIAKQVGAGVLVFMPGLRQMLQYLGNKGITETHQIGELHLEDIGHGIPCLRATQSPAADCWDKKKPKWYGPCPFCGLESLTMRYFSNLKKEWACIACFDGLLVRRVYICAGVHDASFGGS